jgi:uncharacterized protein
MNDLAAALGLVLVFEGLLWALAPETAKHMLETAATTPPATLKVFGWGAVAAGALIVWLVRG